MDPLAMGVPGGRAIMGVPGMPLQRRWQRLDAPLWQNSSAPPTRPGSSASRPSTGSAWAAGSRLGTAAALRPGTTSSRPRTAASAAAVMLTAQASAEAARAAADAAMAMAALPVPGEEPTSPDWEAREVNLPPPSPSVQALAGAVSDFLGSLTEGGAMPSQAMPQHAPEVLNLEDPDAENMLLEPAEGLGYEVRPTSALLSERADSAADWGPGSPAGAAEERPLSALPPELRAESVAEFLAAFAGGEEALGGDTLEWVPRSCQVGREEAPQLTCSAQDFSEPATPSRPRRQPLKRVSVEVLRQPAAATPAEPSGLGLRRSRLPGGAAAASGEGLAAGAVAPAAPGRRALLKRINVDPGRPIASAPTQASSSTGAAGAAGGGYPPAAAAEARPCGSRVPLRRISAPTPSRPSTAQPARPVEDVPARTERPHEGDARAGRASGAEVEATPPDVPVEASLPEAAPCKRSPPLLSTSGSAGLLAKAVRLKAPKQERGGAVATDTAVALDTGMARQGLTLTGSLKGSLGSLSKSSSLRALGGADVELVASKQDELHASSGELNRLKLPRVQMDHSKVTADKVSLLRSVYRQADRQADVAAAPRVSPQPSQRPARAQQEVSPPPAESPTLPKSPSQLRELDVSRPPAGAKGRNAWTSAAHGSMAGHSKMHRNLSERAGLGVSPAVWAEGSRGTYSRGDALARGITASRSVSALT